MGYEGSCRCEAVSYRIDGDALHHAVCHCGDCRASSGSPMVAWLAVKEEQFSLLQGEPAMYEGTPGARRYFCPICGTGLFYRNAEMLPGIVDVQSTTLGDSSGLEPGAQIQCAERLPWMSRLADLPEFERFPGA